MNGYMGSRSAFARAVTDIAALDPRAQVISTDSALTAGLADFAERYPANFVEVGIAEQCGVDVAVGLASSGLLPYICTFAGFLTMRACEQIRTFIAYPRLNVKIVGFNGGMLGGGREGVTHQFYEDIGILRTIPNISIVCPADGRQTYQALMALTKADGPAYVRIANNREADVTDRLPGDFEIGKIRIIRDHGSDLALFTHGFVMDKAIRAAEQLLAIGVKAKLLEVHTLRPLDVGGIIEALCVCGRAVTLEDHNVVGGLGSAVAEIIAEHMPARLIRLGLRETFAQSGEPDELLHAYGVDEEAVIKAAKLLCGI